MATLQSVNGKAPSNAKVGDEIVTNGGTWKITGQNSDGSWISQKVSNISKNSGTSSGSGSKGTYGTSSSGSSRPSGGSASGVNVYDDYQQDIRDQMNANSQAWHNAATKEEKDRLHAENERLSGLLGGDVSYDGSTGRWSGSADAPAAPSDSRAEGYTPSDQSDYLEKMAAAYLEQQKEALKQAYESNLSELQAEQDKLGVNYQAARNQEAASSALSRQRWNETASAYGLNSGTAGQAQLSYANRLQSDLSALQAAESAANAEIERQRTNLSKEYQSAMTQAQAENDYRLFEQLYQEAVRLDQALQQQSQFNAQMALQQYQTMLDKYYNDRSFQYTQQQNSRNEQFEAAALAAQMGDYSLYGKLYNWDDAKTQRMEDSWKAMSIPQTAAGGAQGYAGLQEWDSELDARQAELDAIYQRTILNGDSEKALRLVTEKLGELMENGLSAEKAQRLADKYGIQLAFS